MSRKKSKMLRLDEAAREDVRAALYVRVSTDAQREEGYSVEIQKERLVAYAASMFGKDAHTELYVDDGYSGGSLDRPAMTRLIADAEAGRLTHVFVYKLDRLSRSQKDTLYLIEDVFLPNGTAFVSVQESFNTATAFGRAVVGMLSVFAQLERENIFERTRSGMQKRVESGLWMGGGGTPYGYDYDSQRGILVPNADAENVRRVYELYLRGHSLQHIANVLGLKYEKLAWQILTRKSNTGVIVYNGVEYPGRHEPIVSPETYEAAMAQLRERSARKYVSSSPHLLTGLVFCGRCGAKMRYRKWGKAGYRLVCYSQQKDKAYLVRDPDCDNARPCASELEAVVTDDLFRMTAPDMGGEAAPCPTALELLTERKRAASQKLRRLYTLYAEGHDEVLDAAVGEARDALSDIDAQIDSELRRKRDGESSRLARERIRGLRQAWRYMTVQERRLALSSVIRRITVTGEDVTIDYFV